MKKNTWEFVIFNCFVCQALIIVIDIILIFKVVYVFNMVHNKRFTEQMVKVSTILCIIGQKYIERQRLVSYIL